MARKARRKGRPLKGRPPSLRDQLKAERARQELVQMRRQEHGAATAPPDPGKWHRDNAVKTALAAVIGVVMGVLFAYAAGDAVGTNFSLWAMLFFVIFLAYAQKLLYPFLGVSVEKFKLRDWFFTAFMTFAFWLITWAILLN